MYKTRLVLFMIFAISAIVLAGSIVVNAINNVTDNFDKLSDKEMEFINTYDQVEVKIVAGDTSWDIQKRLVPNTDVRKLLYYCGKINNKCMGEIKTGETLIFLKEKK